MSFAPHRTLRINLSKQKKGLSMSNETTENGRVSDTMNSLVSLLTEIRGLLKIIMCVAAFATGLIMFR